MKDTFELRTEAYHDFKFIAVINMLLAAVKMCVFHILSLSHIVYHTCLSSTGSLRTHKNNQLPVGLIAQLVEHCTGITEVMGSIPVQAWIFSGFLSLLLK